MYVDGEHGESCGEIKLIGELHDERM